MDLVDDSKSEPLNGDQSSQESSEGSSHEIPPSPLPITSPAQTTPTGTDSPVPTSPPENPLSDTLSFQSTAIVEERPTVNLLSGKNGFEKDRTVISQRPVAAPNEYFKSLPLGDLAAMLEGRLLDHFAVQQIIGGGGMGAVFRGVDQRLDRVVAIKVIPGSKRDPETLRRFRIEAQAAARLDHPNIARVFYVGEAEQWNYIVFEFIDGVNIRDLVDMDGSLAIDDAVFYTRQIAEALQHAHEREVVHRDIKPSNILVTPSGMAKLVDMGLARDTSMDKSTGDQTASGVTLGTFDYISPEQARNPRDADVRSDLYSLGCSLFFMLTGHPPFPEGTALQKLLNHGSLPPPDPRGWREDISDQLYDILMKLMAKRPTDRYQKPVELVNDLLLLAEQENLPRSQGPSTITLSPSLSQPTLLETHLPWIVAAVVLLGSTVWLHGQISSATGFAFPTVAFPAAESSGNLNSRLSPTTNPPASIKETPPQPTVTRSPSAIETTAANVTAANAPATNIPAANVTPANITLANAPAANVAATNVTLGPLNGSTLNNISESAAVPPQVTTTVGPKNVMLEPVIDLARLPTKPAVKPAAIVVSATQPSGVAIESWEPSLWRALQRLTSQSGAAEIEIRGSIVLDKPLEIQGFSDITIRGVDADSRIEIDRGLWSAVASGSGAVRIIDASLTLRAIQLRCTSLDSNGTTSTARSLIHMAGNSSLIGKSVEFTLQGDRASSLHLVSAGDLSGSSTRPIVATNSLAAKLTLDNCMIRGVTSVFKIDQSLPNSMDTVQIGLTNSIVAVSGRVVDFVGAAGDSGVDRIVRFYCDRTSFIAEEGFAQLEYIGQGQPLVGFNRTSQACLFWSKPEKPHIRIVGEDADPSENPDQLMLQGMDNAYDQNLGQLCVLSRGDARIADKTVLEGQQAGWYNERSTERVIRWKSSPSTLRSLTEVRPTDFQLVPSYFVPGFRPSAN